MYASLHDKVCNSLHKLNKAIAELLAEQNKLTYQKKIGGWIQKFETLEKEKLQALPKETFELRKYQQAKFHSNCHVVLSQDNMGTPSPLLCPHLVCSKKIDL